MEDNKNLKTSSKSHIELCDELVSKVEKGMKELETLLNTNGHKEKGEALLRMRADLSHLLHPAALKLKKEPTPAGFKSEKPKLENLRMPMGADREDIKKAVEIADKEGKDVVLTGESAKAKFAKIIKEGKECTKRELMEIHKEWAKSKHKK